MQQTRTYNMIISRGEDVGSPWVFEMLDVEYCEQGEHVGWHLAKTNEYTFICVALI